MTHAVVIGGSRGLGLVVVERLLKRGIDVTIVSRKPPNLDVRHLAVDLEDIDSLYDVPKAVSPISYLIFCQRYRGLGDAWDGEIKVGLTATRMLIEGFADHFVQSGDRAISVVSSVYAEYVGGSQPIGYHVVKAGLNAMVRYYAYSLGRRGIRVNSIMPLTYQKPEIRAYFDADERSGVFYEQLVPLGRMGNAEDSADALSFLCSEQASFINGQSIRIDGGVSAIWPEETAKTFSKR
jgi:NAD(P)-dependent dehydrogenase (short-subunit alcohol dehydrogenase family)